MALRTFLCWLVMGQFRFRNQNCNRHSLKKYGKFAIFSKLKIEGAIRNFTVTFDVIPQKIHSQNKINEILLTRVKCKPCYSQWNWNWKCRNVPSLILLACSSITMMNGSNLITFHISSCTVTSLILYCINCTQMLLIIEPNLIITHSYTCSTWNNLSIFFLSGNKFLVLPESRWVY